MDRRLRAGVAGVAVALLAVVGPAGSSPLSVRFGRVSDASSGNQRAESRHDTAIAATELVVPDPTTTIPHRDIGALAALDESGRPPQFVVLSFDGVGDVDTFERWLDLGDSVDARFTFFLSGVYLLGEQHRLRYDPPGWERGRSDIGFADVATIPRRVELLNRAHRHGHEIGTHYNGHRCGNNRGSVKRFDPADWVSELDQWADFVSRTAELNGLDPDVRVDFDPTEVLGGRTPCLEGDLALLADVGTERGMRYDASSVGEAGRWPTVRDGFWDFPLGIVPLGGDGPPTVSMDYNVYARQSGANPVSSPERLERFGEQAYQTWTHYIETNLAGSRAPVFVGNHFAPWNRGAYVDAAMRFTRDHCGRPEVHCVSYAELVTWLDRHGVPEPSEDGVATAPSALPAVGPAPTQPSATSNPPPESAERARAARVGVRRPYSSPTDRVAIVAIASAGLALGSRLEPPTRADLPGPSDGADRPPRSHARAFDDFEVVAPGHPARP